MHNKISQLQTQFEDYMYSRVPGATNSVYDPLRYILSLPAKRVRPALTLLAANMYGKPGEAAFAAALSVEVFHNFSLLHDDIMDEATLRRGEKAAHHLFGINSTLLAGDLMLLYSIQYLDGIRDDAMLREATREFLHVGIRICEGQQLDMDFETRNRVTVDEYLVMIEGKTAVLLGLSLRLGALVSGASARETRLLFDLGVNAGMAFQLQDDILDLYGTPEAFGKTPGGDILQNKKTILYTLALRDLSVSGREDLINAYQSEEFRGEEKIQRVRDLFQAADVRNKAEALQIKYRTKAAEILKELNGDRDGLSDLSQFLAMVFDRQY